MPSLILAIETSQRDGAVALFTPPSTVDAEPLVTASRHDDDLVPAIDRLLHRAGGERRDLSAVGVSIGPGGFTGLRIAIAAVKMLALALDVRVVAVPTALVVAESLPDLDGKSLVVALASKRDTFWATRVVRHDDGWHEDGPGILATAETVRFDGAVCVAADEHLPGAARTRILDAGVAIVPPRFDVRACLDITRRMLADDATIDPHVLAPLYPRPPEAVAKWREQRR